MLVVPCIVKTQGEPKDEKRARVLTLLPSSPVTPLDAHPPRHLPTDPFEFTLGENKVIKGWEVAVLTMRIGERAQLTCAAAYGYGDAGSEDDVAPGATLVFDIELVGTKNVVGAGRDGAATEVERLAALRAERAELAAKKEAEKEAKEAAKAEAQAKLQVCTGRRRGTRASRRAERGSAPPPSASVRPLARARPNPRLFFFVSRVERRIVRPTGPRGRPLLPPPSNREHREYRIRVRVWCTTDGRWRRDARGARARAGEARGERPEGQGRRQRQEEVKLPAPSRLPLRAPSSAPHRRGCAGASARRCSLCALRLAVAPR